MPVYDRRYRGYAGERRGERSGVAVVARYGLAEAFSSRLLLLMFVASCLPFVVFAMIIYVANNLDVLPTVQIDNPTPLLESLSGRIFHLYLVIQSSFAFVLASFAGPALVGPDLAHGAMPLYLSRPLSRAEYVLGKLAILAAMLSAVTWVPGLLLVGLEGALAEDGWLVAHWRIPFGIFVGAWVWILLLGTLALAISAWIRWRPLATGALFGIFFIGSAFGAAIELLLGTRWGRLLNLGELVKAVWNQLFGSSPLLGGSPAESLPPGAAWLALGLVGGAAILILRRRIRAFEVVR